MLTNQQFHTTDNKSNSHKLNVPLSIELTLFLDYRPISCNRKIEKTNGKTLKSFLISHKCCDQFYLDL